MTTYLYPENPATAVVATNWATDPRATGTGMWEGQLGGGTLTQSFLSGVNARPPGTDISTIYRLQPNVEMVFPDAIQHVYRASPAGWSVPIGGDVPGAIWMRSMDRDCETRVVIYNEPTGATPTTGPWVPVTGSPAGTQWVRLYEIDTVEGMDSTGFQVRVQTRQLSGGDPILAGDRFDVTGVAVGLFTDRYFDGDTPDDFLARTVYDWTDTPNASPSIESVILGDVTPELVMNYEHETDTGVITHQPVSGGPPLIVRRALAALPTGTFEFFAQNRAVAENIASLCDGRRNVNMASDDVPGAPFLFTPTQAGRMRWNTPYDSWTVLVPYARLT